MSNIETRRKIASDLEALGVKKGDCLLIHTSFSSLGKGIDAADLAEGIKDALGENGTLIVPTLSWSTVTKKNPIFDVKNTPVCIGYFPEFFRKYKDVVRSVHPTHSCAATGASAIDFVSSHYLDRTPVGKNSPFRKLGERPEGKILFIGCPSTPNTSMHGIEELVEPDYLYGDDIEYTLTDNDGKTYNALYRTHGFARTEQRYERAEMLLSPDELSKGKILCADCTLMSASALWKKGAEALKSNPHCFVNIR